MVLPTTYWGTEGWWEETIKSRGTLAEVSRNSRGGLAQDSRKTRVEVMESFPKQTYRNRCLIIDPTGTSIMLSVPVKRVDHKQFTKDVEISYQTKWQHQHWNAILSAYKKTPYFDYYQDFIRPLYEKETKWLIDLNDATLDVVEALLRNEMPKIGNSSFLHTEGWAGLDLENIWGNETCVLDKLFKYGPLALQQ